MSNRMTFTNRVAAYFKAQPNVWIDGVALETVGGRYAWRSRVSDCRTALGMDIQNRQQRQTDADGRTWVISWYMYTPSADERPAVLVAGHDLNQPSTGRLL
jgi:hypothetical protein